MRSIRIPYFRIWYSSLFVILFVITFVLTLVSPADLIYQSIVFLTKNDASRRVTLPGNVISIGGGYLLTALVVLFIWAQRIYTNRSIMREIPKQYLPLDHGEVPKKVRKVIEKQWERSALVAWDARPRDVTEEIRAQEIQEDEDARKRGESLFHRRGHGKSKTVIPASSAMKAWGQISHPGWAAPSALAADAATTENVQYWSVIVELPHLLEAKAASLAPPDPMFGIDGSTGTSLPPDPRVVELLQRPTGMGLRDYLSRLASFVVFEPPEAVEDFLVQYEFARFSTHALTEDQFKALMANFASVLATMTLDAGQIAAEISAAEEGFDPTVSSASSFVPFSHQNSAPSLNSEANGSVRRHSISTHSPAPSFRSLSSVIINPHVHS
jgi:hypothetical protein